MTSRRSPDSTMSSVAVSFPERDRSGVPASSLQGSASIADRSAHGSRWRLTAGPVGCRLNYPRRRVGDDGPDPMGYKSWLERDQVMGQMPRCFAPVEGGPSTDHTLRESLPAAELPPVHL